LVAASLGACVSAEDNFVGARLERLCSQAIPVCDVRASCLLDDKSYVARSFPGGLRLVVGSDRDEATIEVRLYLVTQEAPGTELSVQVHDPACGEYDEERVVDVDPFVAAGDDRVFTWELDLPGRGDHLVEIFSDMTADYLLTVDVLEE
jgi:hypothetical protein